MFGAFWASSQWLPVLAPGHSETPNRSKFGKPTGHTSGGCLPGVLAHIEAAGKGLALPAASV